MVHILAQDFNAISFQDVADFCGQKIVEGAQLDYKQQMPKDLAKHFAAMSNQRGGLIVIGVEEDTKTGLPSKWEGIAYDGKLIDQIHQFAGNVRPLPSYHVRATDEVDGKVFLLIRISEGDAPPYTVLNDPTVYVRVGNTTSRFGQADVNVISDLFAKRTRAEAAQRENIAGADVRLRVLLEQYAPRDDEPRPGASNQITAYMQPFYPNRELTLPRDIFGRLDRLRVTNNEERVFPSRQMRPIARCMLCFERGTRNPSFSCDQIYAIDLVLVTRVLHTDFVVLVPMVVVDELDRLKESKDKHTRWRAGYTLAVLDRLFADGVVRGWLFETDPEPGPLTPRAVGIELLFDPPGHVRLPNSDDEIIDRALSVEPLANRKVTLLTYDTGQSTRARNAGLTVVKLGQEIGDEPK